jgi:hypothetical protein
MFSLNNISDSDVCFVFIVQVSVVVVIINFEIALCTFLTKVELICSFRSFTGQYQYLFLMQ